MEVRVRTTERAVVLQPDAALDSRTAHVFERAAMDALKQSGHHVIIDFSKAELVTSAALRVLFVSRQRLGTSGRTLVLCGMNEMVRGVFEITGLLSVFTIAATEADALAALPKAPSAAPVTPRGSKLAQHVLRLLTLGATDASSPQHSMSAATATELATAVHDLLDVRAARPAG